MREKGFERRQLLAVALGTETARRAHELEQVLDTRLAALGLLALVMLDETARLQYVIDLLVQRAPLDLERQALDQRHETGNRRRGLRAERTAARLGRLPQRGAASPRMPAQRVEALRADAAHRQVHHAFEGRIVLAIRQKAQVRERVLDLRALEEPQAAIDPVRNTRRQKYFLEHTRLRIRAIQNRDLAPQAAVLDVIADAIENELRLVALVESRIDADGISLGAAGPQILAETPGVVRDQGIGAAEDVARGAIVLFETEELRLRKVALEMLHVLRARSAEAVHRVMSDDSVCDEVVRVLDVQIEHFGINVLVFHSLHDIELIRLGGHDHAGADAGRLDEWQRSPEHAALQNVTSLEGLADAPRDRHQLTEIPSHRFKTPGFGSRLRGSHGESDFLESFAIRATVAAHGDAMHGARAPSVSAQRDDDVAADRIATAWQVLWPLGVEPDFIQQALCGRVRIDTVEYPLDVGRIVHEPVAAAPFSSHEGECR